MKTLRIADVLAEIQAEYLLNISLAFYLHAKSVGINYGVHCEYFGDSANADELI
jgi:hypothetical protein